jgi:hypothetical protein
VGTVVTVVTCDGTGAMVNSRRYPYAAMPGMGWVSLVGLSQTAFGSIGTSRFSAEATRSSRPVPVTLRTPAGRG